MIQKNKTITKIQDLHNTLVYYINLYSEHTTEDFL